MARVEKQSFVFIATAWGPLKGGINALNMDLCIAVAAEEVLVACVVGKENKQAIADAEAKQILLIPFGEEPRDPSVAEQLIEIVRREGFATNSWWIGHDMITGNLAVRAAKLAGGRAAVIHHMHHLTYKLIEGEVSKKVQSRDIEQRELLQGAQLVVVIGPSLSRSADDLLRGATRRPAIIELIPGLADVKPEDAPSNFAAVVLGRFEDSSAKTKQLDLSVAAFGRAAQNANGPLGHHPNLTIYGSPETTRTRLSKLVEPYATRRVDLHPLDFEIDRQKLFSEIARKSVVMMLSWYEAFGLVAWEAIAAGVPLIISRATGAYQQLRIMFREEADHLVEAVDIKAAADSSTLREEDVAQVAAALTRIATDPKSARERARDLRQRLIEANISWQIAAQRLIEKCAAVDEFSPAIILQSDQQDFICAESGIVNAGKTAVALCLVVDRSDETRASIGSLAERIARARGTSQESADRIVEQGFASVLDQPEVYREIVNFATTAPIRAYVIVMSRTGLVAPKELRKILFSGLFQERFKKRDLHLHAVCVAQDVLNELTPIVQDQWTRHGRNRPIPAIAAEVPSKRSLMGIALTMAAAVAAVAESGDSAEFKRLRLKFAHIFDFDNRKNYRSDDEYP